MSDDADRLKDQADAFAAMWADLASRMGPSGPASGARVPPPDAARQVRDTMFEAMSAYCDRFMRSPEFLGQLKQSLDGAIEVREQLNAFLTQVRHDTQGVSLQDIDGLRQAIEGLQHVIAERIGRVDERLDAIEARLKNPPARTTSTKAKPASTRRAQSKKAKKATRRPRPKPASTARRTRKGT